MNTIKLIALVLTMVIGFTKLPALNLNEDFSNHKIIKLTEMDAKTLDEFSLAHTTDTVVECSKGTTLPCKFKVKGQFLALDSGNTPLSLKVEKTCFIRCLGEDNFVYSGDLKNWKDFFEFFTGGINLNVFQDGENLVKLEIELNQR